MRVGYLEDMTREQWLAERRKGIGGSDAASALGMSPFKSAWDLHWEKRGELGDDLEQTEAMYWGTVLEPVIAARWQADNPHHTIDDSKILYAHDTQPWRRFTPDRLIDDDGILEVKTTNAFQRHRWDDGEVPDAYLIQCVWGMHVLDRDWCELAVLVGGNDYRTKRFERNLQLEELIVADITDFWDNVQTGNPPSPIGDDHVASIYPTHTPDTTIALDDLTPITAAKQLAERAKAAKDAEAEAKNQLRALLGDKERLTYDGRTVATWKTNAKGARVLRIS